MSASKKTDAKAGLAGEQGIDDSTLADVVGGTGGPATGRRVDTPHAPDPHDPEGLRGSSRDPEHDNLTSALHTLFETRPDGTTTGHLTPGFYPHSPASGGGDHNPPPRGAHNLGPPPLPGPGDHHFSSDDPGPTRAPADDAGPKRAD
jgi:hypothetical protein